MEGYTEVFAWGGDHFGQLGLGGKTTSKTYASPRFCSFNITIKDLSCGEEHAAFISSSGHIYTMGSNADGRLGIGERTLRQSASPCLVEELASSNAIKISCGWGHTAIITDLGEVFTWGIGEFGSLGTGNIETKWSPAQMLLKGIALDISCGSRHTGVIAKDKSGRKQLLMCGGGEAGQLGTGKREKELVAVVVDLAEEPEEVACGVFHSAVTTARGNLYTMGGNSFGQLGLGNKKSQSRPEKVTHLENVFIRKVRCSNFTAAISDKGYLYIWGSGVFGEYLLPHRWSLREPIVDIAAGSGFGVAIDNLSSVYVWGGNSNGELGLDDYDPRTAPTVIPSLKGKSLKKIACGGNFCVGLGSDVLPRGKTPDRNRKTEAKRSEDISTKTRVNEMEKLSFEVKQTYKSYEEIKRSFENLSEKYEVDKRNHHKYVEELNREISKYKQEVERCRNQIELDDREIREMGVCIDELKRVNLDVNLEASSYKDELMRYKKTLEENKQVSRLEIRKFEDLREMEIEELKDIICEESVKRKQLEMELERANQTIYTYEDTIRNCQMEINEIGMEMQQNSVKADNDRKRLQSVIEKQQRELGEIIRKHEIISAEKDTVQSMLKADIEKIFKENKDLKYQVEATKEQASLKTQENVDLIRQLNLLSSEKQTAEGSLLVDIERISKDNTDLKRKFDSALNKLQELDSVKLELSRCRSENSDYLSKIERIYHENQSLSQTIFDLTQKLDSANGQLSKLDSLDREVQRLTYENSQLLLKIDYLTTDKERVSANLSAEIEQLSQQKSEIMQKYDMVYVEKEKKSHVLTLEIEKFSKENFELKRKYDLLSIENEKNSTLASGLSQEIKSIKHQYDCLLMENKNYNSIIHDTSAENNEIKIRLQQTSQDKDLLIDRLKSDLDSATKDNFDSKRAIELLKQEKNTISSSLSSDINSKLAELSTKSSEIMRLSNENQQKDRELFSLQKKIIDQESELQRYQTQIHLLHTENSEIKSSLESMRFDLEKMHLKITDQEFLYRSTKESALDWEDRFCRLNEENSSLKLEVNELQCKNRQLFDNLEKELSQRAKDYKERTMTMLMNPYRSNSPHMRPPTPMDQDRIRHISYIRSQTPVNEDRGSIDEFNGNTAAKLLQTLEDSPKARSSNKTTLRTPTKEDIKSKIAQLMSNRSRLEHEIKMMDE